MVANHDATSVSRRPSLLTQHLTFGQQHANKFRVEPMAASVSHHLADDFTARKGEVANQVECFVSNAFVFESQFVSQRSRVAEDDDVRERYSRPQSATAQPLGLGEQRAN